MKSNNPITEAISILSSKSIAQICGVTYQAVQKWEKNGRLPRTDWTGESNYAQKIAEATNGRLSILELRPDKYPLS